jgi:hypothetical protein
MRTRPYTKAGRLSDVLALIQVLALDPHTHRSEDGLQREFQRLPVSAESWITVAEEHPEFFRVAKGKLNPMSLVARHVTPEDETEEQRMVPSDFLYRLLQTAIDLRDREVEATERWKYLIPLTASIVGGIITGVFTVLAVWLKK